MVTKPSAADEVTPCDCDRSAMDASYGLQRARLLSVYDGGGWGIITVVVWLALNSDCSGVTILMLHPCLQSSGSHENVSFATHTTLLGLGYMCSLVKLQVCMLPQLGVLGRCYNMHCRVRCRAALGS